MIDYSATERGDILKIVPPGAPEFAANGDLVRVLERTVNGVKVENKHGKTCEFVYNCGAERLEPTEWKNDFPEENKTSDEPETASASEDDSGASEEAEDSDKG